MSQTWDLGEISAPLLVFGGPYSNLEATQALRSKTEELGIPATQCLCTGDIVAYCAEPLETVALLRDWGVHLVMGNCEESLSQGATDCGCGFDIGTSCDLLSKQWFDYASSRIEPEMRQWMGQLPQRIAFEFEDARAVAIHGGATQINRFLFASQPTSDFEQELESLDADLVLAGHCGIPFTRQFGSHLWHNAGVIGLPANDGQRETWYSLLEPSDGGGIQISHHRLQYDAKTCAEKMTREGLTGGYDKTLLSGIWPSQDVLPASERKKQGAQLQFEKTIWRPPL